MTTTTVEILCIRRLLNEFHLPTTKPTKLYCDNILAIAHSTDPKKNIIFHSKMKHIDIDCALFETISILRTVHYISTIDQIANILTKYLPNQRSSDLCSKFTLQPRFCLWGDNNVLQPLDPNRTLSRCLPHISV